MEIPNIHNISNNVEIKDIKADKADKADKLVLTLFNDLISDLEAQIITGKIINLEDFERNINFIKNNINKYNNLMNEWYDSDYLTDKENFNNILDKFNNESNIYKELSFVAINNINEN